MLGGRGGDGWGREGLEVPGPFEGYKYYIAQTGNTSKVYQNLHGSLRRHLQGTSTHLQRVVKHTRDTSKAPPTCGKTNMGHVQAPPTCGETHIGAPPTHLQRAGDSHGAPSRHRKCVEILTWRTAGAPQGTAGAPQGTAPSGEILPSL